jgi:hypothetical protein
MLTVAVMPTIPSRATTARAVVARLLPQVDRMVIVLNGHGGVPAWYQNAKIVTCVNPAGTGPGARYRVGLPERGHVLFVDDDLEYPANYVAKAREDLGRLGPRTVIAYHGAYWRAGSRTAYQDRQLVHYESASAVDVPISFAGSGTISVRAEELASVQRSVPPQHDMYDDVWISGALARAGLRVVRPRTPERWIRSTPAAHDGLYKRAMADRFAGKDRSLRAVLALGGWKLVLEEANSLQPTAHRQEPRRQPTADSRQPRQPTADSRQPTAQRTKNVKTYADERFWKERHARLKDIRAVGLATRSVADNERDYVRQRAELQRYLDADLPRMRRDSALELGYGQGHWSRFCKDAGFARYVGLDFAAPRGPDLGSNYAYQRADVGARFDLKRRFDLVLAIDVLFHVTDEARFEIALDNIRRHAGGIIYVTGRMRDEKLAAHVIHRSLDRFRSLGRLISIHPWRDTAIARFSV